jgi:hypothetical protein
MAGGTQTTRGWSGSWGGERRRGLLYKCPHWGEDEGEEELVGEGRVYAARTEEQEEVERDGWWTPDHSWLEMEAEEEGEEEALYLSSVISGRYSEDERADDSGVGEDCTPPEKPNLTRVKKKEGEDKKVSVRKRPKRKRSEAAGVEWEAVLRNAWLWELLSSSSEEEGEEPEEKRARMGEKKYQRCKESSRWLAETDPAGWGRAAKPEFDLEPSREEGDSGGEISTHQTEIRRGGPVTDKMEALVLLEGRVRAIGVRLEQIVARMGELQEEDKEHGCQEGLTAAQTHLPTQARR